MTEKLIKTYHSLNVSQKTVLIITTLLLLVGSSVMVAIAGSGITFSSLSPGSGASVAGNKPNISVDVAATGTIEASDVQMQVDGETVVPSLAPLAAAGNYRVSYTPALNLAEGNHAVTVSVYDAVEDRAVTKDWTFKVDNLPRIISTAPAEGAVIDAASTTVSVNVKDTFDRLNSGSVTMKFGGQTVTPNFQYKGHDEYDSCGVAYWIIDSYQEGTISYYAGNLKDGEYPVEVSIADDKGNVSTANWSFKVASKPKLSGLTPVNGALINTNTATTVSATIKDDVSVDAATVKMNVDGADVTPNYDPATGKVSYSTNFTQGSHTVIVSAKDTSGNTGTATWSFSISGDANPQASGFVPANGGTVSAPNPKLSVLIKDTYDDLDAASVSMTIDGTPVAPSFEYKGHWFSDSCGSYYIVDSYKEGTITYQTANLADGEHTVGIRIADKKGNVLQTSWKFTVGTAPKFSGLSPASKAQTNIPKITAVITDSNAIDWSTLVMKVDNNSVVPVIDQATGTVTYTGTLTNGTKTVFISVKDVNGNPGSTTWDFTYNTAGPTLDKFFLYHQGTPSLTWDGYRLINGGGLTLFNGILSVEMRLKSLVDIAKADLLLDGQLLASELRYPSLTDSCSGEVTITTKKEASVFYNKPVADGDHTLTLNVQDALGNKTTYSWPMVVKSSPFVKEVTPVEYGVKTQTPVISAKLTDNNGTINPATIVMKVNGQVVQHNFDSATGKVSFTVTEALADESYHSVTITAADNAGLQVARTWKFYINAKGYPDMADSNPANCSACHAVGANALQSSYHNGVPFSGDHGTASSGCYDCHTYISYPADCAQCHGDVDFDYAPHGSSPSIQYTVQKFDPNMPQRVKQNREVFDCVLCHQPGSRAGATTSPVIYKDQWGYNVPTYNEYGELVVQTQQYWSRANYSYTNLLNNHDIPELHKVSDSTCGKCHALSITREHARPGRADTNGQPINCNTCHKNTSEKVKAAIANNDTSCTACHESADHESLHEGNLDNNCQTCHKATLTSEHISNTTTAGKNYDCDTCHASGANQVKRTIGANSLNCAGCHTEGHNMNFVDEVPADILLHTSFNWTTPIEASIFAGEPSIPANYGTGQVVQSNRSQTVTVEQAWNFYNEKLLANGWVMKSAAPPAGAQRLMAEFEKEGRFVTVQLYNTANRDGSGPVIGTKTEVWYK